MTCTHYCLLFEDCPTVQVDETDSKVRAITERSSLILRAIPDGTTQEVCKLKFRRVASGFFLAVKIISATYYYYFVHKSIVVFREI